MKRTPLSIQPIPYQGSKRSLAPRICEHFPRKVETLYEPFAGSAAITLYAAAHNLAEKYVIGDSYAPLMALWKLIIDDPDELSHRYSELWHKQFESEAHFNTTRSEFNESGDPVALLYLIARCVKNAVRFNRLGNFTQSADKRRTGMQPERLRKTAFTVSSLLKGRTQVFVGDFQDCISSAQKYDLIYLDPPYQGTTYGADKRYAFGLETDTLISALHRLDEKRTQYILSYDGQTGEKHYGSPLPSSVQSNRLMLNAGRSSQATMNGRNEDTIESLYVSKSLESKINGKTIIEGSVELLTT
jgi:DNA adenine methylase